MSWKLKIPHGISSGLRSTLFSIEQRLTQKVTLCAAERINAVSHTNTGGWEKVALNLAPIDVLSEFSTADGKLTLKNPGDYFISATVAFASETVVAVNLYKNGSLLIVGDSGTNYNVSLDCIISLVKDDYLELYAYQSSGGDLAYSLANKGVRMTAHKISV